MDAILTTSAASLGSLMGATSTPAATPQASPSKRAQKGKQRQAEGDSPASQPGTGLAKLNGESATRSIPILLDNIEKVYNDLTTLRGEVAAELAALKLTTQRAIQATPALDSTVESLVRASLEELLDGAIDRHLEDIVVDTTVAAQDISELNQKYNLVVRSTNEVNKRLDGLTGSGDRVGANVKAIASEVARIATTMTGVEETVRSLLERASEAVDVLNVEHRRQVMDKLSEA
ncbi:hypothetical protein EVJ58_g9674 [Rhodofomes roseus]|uniref:Uncharacterized protein n=1 Tax=Rhodofomes roseus TaxID=34475 RepID=A0A4Y9XUD1_9APHY|nr:hypothetical protein EVJ58_g9674 [Rhodofomes roseus]